MMSSLTYKIIISILRIATLGKDREKCKIVLPSSSFANIDESPFVVLIVVEHIEICQGSILSQRFVVTTASCVSELLPEQIRVKYGTLNKEYGGFELEVDQITLHPKYKYPSADYDVAMLKILFYIPFGHIAGAVEIGNCDALGCKPLNFVGWSFAKQPNDEIFMTHAEANVIPQKNCSDEVGPYVTERMICTEFLQKEYFCKGEIGTPVTFGGKLVGMYIYGSSCEGYKQFNVCLNLHTVQDFIQNTIDSDTGDFR